MPLIHRDDAEAAGAVVLVCTRCLWRWARHGDHDPVSCPKCRTTYWNRERSRDFDLRGGARKRLRRTPLRIRLRHSETLDETLHETHNETLREGAGDAPPGSTVELPPSSTDRGVHFEQTLRDPSL